MQEYLKVIRDNINLFLNFCVNAYVEEDKQYLLLEIGENDTFNGAKAIFPSNVTIKTLDIIEKTKPDYLGDICKKNEDIPDESFDFVCLCEVLEHTYAPWKAPEEIMRILKPNGMVFVTVPLNFEIHPPMPDYWRFTSYGLKELFKKFDIIDVKNVAEENRKGFPIHYTMVARKKI